MKKAHGIGAPKKMRSMIYFLSLKKEQVNEVPEVLATPPPPPSPTSFIHESPSSSSSLEGSSSERSKRFGILQDLYDLTENIDNIIFLSI